MEFNYPFPVEREHEIFFEFNDYEIRSNYEIRGHHSRVVLVSLASKYDKFYYIIIFFVAIEFFPLPRLKDQ